MHSRGTLAWLLNTRHACRLTHTRVLSESAQNGLDLWAFVEEAGTIDGVRVPVVYITVIGTNQAGRSSRAHSNGVQVRCRGTEPNVGDVRQSHWSLCCGRST